MNIKANVVAGPCRVFTFVDDFLGAGSLKDASESQDVAHTVIRGFEGLSLEKNVFALTAEILHIQP